MNSRARQLPLDIKLRDDATFANYVGDAPEHLHSAGNFVYVWGEQGSGRTHLLQAACHRAWQTQQPAMYLSGLQQYEPEILQDLESRALICLDDVQSVTGDREWELGLFHLINGVRDNGNRLIVSADTPAGNLSIILEDLRSRLLSAVSVETSRLSDEQKLIVLQQRARNRGFDLSEDVGRFILSRTDRNMGSLIKMLGKLEVETLAHQKKLTIPFVKQTLHL
ncbi:MAG: DnaA regulatory inactivator Hda [Pseudomonadales bacterium]